MRLDWKVGLGVAISALFLWWAFRGEDLGAIWAHLLSAEPVWLAVAGAMATAGGLIRALRWQLLLAPLGAVTSLHARWAALNIGLMVTNIYPARLGEVARPFALSRLAPVSMSAALGTVVLERVLDTVALLLLLVVALLSPSFPDAPTVLGRPIGWAVSGALLLSVTALAVVATIAFAPAPVTRTLQTLGRLLPGPVTGGLSRHLRAFVDGLQLLRTPTGLMKAMVWSLALWIWLATSFWAGFRAFGIDLGATAALFTQCAVSIFVALPAGPGFIGTFQAGVAVSVQEVFGVAAEPTLSLAVGYHLAGFVPVTALGLYYATSLGLRLGSIEADAEAAIQSS